MKKKRYWLFIFDFYYPIGGMEDFKSSFDTIDQAQDYGYAWEEGDAKQVYMRIYDSEENKCILMNDVDSDGIQSWIAYE